MLAPLHRQRKVQELNVESKGKFPRKCFSPRSWEILHPHTVLWGPRSPGPASPRLPIPGTALKGAFVWLQAPQVGGHFIPPPLPLGWDAFSQGPQLACCYGMQACGSPWQRGPGDAGWRSTQSWDTFGMFAWALVILLAMDRHVPSKTCSHTVCWVHDASWQAWWKCKIGACVAQSVRSGCRYLASGFHPKVCSIAASLRCTARLLLPGNYCQHY